jgi:hypothetical protein
MRYSWTAIAMCLVALSGCDLMGGAVSGANPSITSSLDGRFTLSPASERYGVYVLDTRTGAVRYCDAVYLDASKETGVKCGPWSDAPATR